MEKKGSPPLRLLQVLGLVSALFCGMGAAIVEGLLNRILQGNTKEFGLGIVGGTERVDRWRGEHDSFSGFLDSWPL
jgi:hypothetical protein